MDKNFKTFTKEYGYIAKLAKAVYKQMGCEDDEEFFEEMNGVASCCCGAAGGFRGFTWYSDTVEFWRKNRKLIKKDMAELADSLGETVIGMVLQFKGVKADYTEEEVGKALYGNYDSDFDSLYNTFSFYALEEVANRVSDYAYECENKAA